MRAKVLVPAVVAAVLVAASAASADIQLSFGGARRSDSGSLGITLTFSSGHGSSCWGYRPQPIYLPRPVITHPVRQPVRHDRWARTSQRRAPARIAPKLERHGHWAYEPYRVRPGVTRYRRIFVGH